MSIPFLLLGLLGVATGVLATVNPGYVFRRENVLFEGDEELSDIERAVVRRGAGIATILIGVVLLVIGTL